MRKTSVAAVLLIALLLLLGPAGVSQAQLVLYDDFNVKPINPAKWWGAEFLAGAVDTEAIRKIAQGQLRIDLTNWGRTDSDSGTGFSALELLFTNPASITTIQADVTVKKAKVVGCAANPRSTRARARILGIYFNDGTSPGPGNRIGDILAVIQKSRDSIAGDLIEAFISRCTNAPCTTSITLAYQVFVTSWTEGVADTLRLQWDPANDRFVYTVNPAGVNETITLGYLVPDTNPPVANARDISASNAPASCQSGPRTSATMKALFDNVMVNP